MSAPSTDCQAISRPGSSSVTTESHSTVLPAGALTTQCERRSSIDVDPLDILHEPRQVREVAPEGVDLGARPVDRDGAADQRAAIRGRIGPRVLLPNRRCRRVATW